MKQVAAGPLGWIVGLISFSLLGFELGLMRLLSYVQWHHFASMVISVALIGFGASGTILSLFQKWFLERAQQVLLVAIAACGLTVGVIPFLLTLFTLDPFLLIADPVRFVPLTLFYVVLSSPFLLGATVIGLTFLLVPDRIGRVYFFNLAGSGMGTVSAVLLMNILSPHQLIAVLGLIIVLSTLLLPAVHWRQRLILVLFLSPLVLVVGFIAPLRIEMSQYKALAKTMLLPKARIVDQRWGPTGIVDIVDAPALRYAPGLSLNYSGDIPRQRGVFHDGEWVGTQIAGSDSSAWSVLENSASIVPYRVRSPHRVLVLGAGTGSELRLAGREGAGEAVGVERDGELVALFNEGYGSDAEGLIMGGHVRMVLEEGRSFLSRDTCHYDLVILPIPEGAVSSSAGAKAVAENYLLTVESFGKMLERLSPKGMIAFSSWMTYPPRGSLRSIATAIEALRVIGVSAPAEHLVVLKSWGMVMTFVSGRPFREGEIQRFRTFSASLGFDPVFLAGTGDTESPWSLAGGDSVFRDAVLTIAGDSAQEFFELYAFDVRPTTDNRPYFSHSVRWSRLSEISRTYGAQGTAFFELGSFFLLLTVIQVLVVSGALVLVPVLPLSRRIQKRTLFIQSFFYFGGIGVGFMVIEMMLIQVFTLFLGDPIYSVSVVVGALLLFSGIGAGFSGRIIRNRHQRIRLIIGGILILFALLAFGGRWIVSEFLSAPLIGRVSVSVLLLAPVALLMGMPFPAGLTLLARSARALVPWSWGINGFLSVAAASLSILVAMEFGFVVLSLVAMGSYMAALLAASGFAGEASGPDRSRVP